MKHQENSIFSCKKWLWSARVILVGVLFIGVYFLSAPLILPMVYDTQFGRIVYKPVLYSLRKDWCGRDIVDWYCYNVCKMSLLIPREPSGPD